MRQAPAQRVLKQCLLDDCSGSVGTDVTANRRKLSGLWPVRYRRRPDRRLGASAENVVTIPLVYQEVLALQQNSIRPGGRLVVKACGNSLKCGGRRGRLAGDFWGRQRGECGHVRGWDSVC